VRARAIGYKSFPTSLELNLHNAPIVVKSVPPDSAPAGRDKFIQRQYCKKRSGSSHGSSSLRENVECCEASQACEFVKQLLISVSATTA